MSDGVRKRLISAIIARCPEGVELAEWIAESLSAIDGRSAEIKVVARDEMDERERHRVAMHALGRRRSGVQAACPHYLSEKYRDPSGGGWGGQECLLCGKDIKYPSGVYDG